jgi:hypothetical protein
MFHEKKTFRVRVNNLRIIPTWIAMYQLKKPELPVKRKEMARGLVQKPSN